MNDDDDTTTADADPIDPARMVFLGACTTALAIAFILLLIGDQVSATTF